MTQLREAVASHSWQRAAWDGSSSVTPHSHVVGIWRPSLARIGFLEPSRGPFTLPGGSDQSNVIVLISSINYIDHQVNSGIASWKSLRSTRSSPSERLAASGGPPRRYASRSPR